ncbi:AI-2E family transporter [Reinekea blandensis]|uniref:AI-2E family transporter n=1 Tax=Reinekea blandensis MED297 TaxID=314283 RepID=A4BC99_9GAMM|nr:AI-2E family transporter [Reinekea blandensis]EAR10165.1 hypothetical protein MED297_13117 [Reinekea sp. MED297] [Reinekea blandensis MED297]
MNEASLSRGLIVIASIFIIIAGLKVAQPIVMPVLVAFFLAALTSPAVNLLVRFRMPLGIAITVVVVLLIGFFYALGRVLGNSTEQFLDRLPDYQHQLELWLVQLKDKVPWLIEDIEQRIAEFQPTDSAIAIVGRLFSGVGSVLTAIVLIVFTLIFTLLESRNASEKLRIAFGDDKTIGYIKRFSKMVQRYLLVKSLISLATGILVAILLIFLGVDYPILWGTFAFLMNFIPNVGSLLAAIPPMILAGLQLGLPGFLITTGGFVAINMIIGNLIEPRLMGKTLDISPLIVFLSLVIWGWILGPIGMLLSIPLTVVIKIALEVYPGTRWIAELISQ